MQKYRFYRLCQKKKNQKMTFFRLFLLFFYLALIYIKTYTQFIELFLVNL